MTTETSLFLDELERAKHDIADGHAQAFFAHPKQPGSRVDVLNNAATVAGEPKVFEFRFEKGLDPKEGWKHPDWWRVTMAIPGQRVSEELFVSHHPFKVSPAQRDRIVAGLAAISRRCSGEPAADPQSPVGRPITGELAPASASPPTATSTPYWSKTMPKKRMAELLGLKVRAFNNLHGEKLDEMATGAWRIDLNQLDGAEREAIENAEPPPTGKARGRKTKTVASK